jgi:hypothetical protein
LKLLKILSIPAIAAGVLTLMTATAYANTAEISAKLNCTSATKVCFDLKVSTADFPSEGRDITVTLLGHKKGDSSNNFNAIGQPQPVHLDQNLNNAIVSVCFDNVTTTDFDSFKLDIKVVGPNFTVNGGTEVTLGPFDNSCPTPSPSPSPSPSTSTSPSTSPSATTTTTLANTGGFDFRFPLIGLILLVAGGTLYVIGASRGRSTTK